MAGEVLGESEKSSHQKISSKSSEECTSLTVPSHPLRIKPAGNAYTATENIKLAVGPFFAALPDEVLVQVLESLDAASLMRLGSTCKALYAFSRLEELWKTLCIEYGPSLSVFYLLVGGGGILVVIFTVAYPEFSPSETIMFRLWNPSSRANVHSNNNSMLFSNICYNL